MRELIDWRAGCGKSACPVLREGWGSNAPFLPLPGRANRSDDPIVVGW
jgi:hypothetical protein